MNTHIAYAHVTCTDMAYVNSFVYESRVEWLDLKTKELFISWPGLELFMSIAQLIGVQLVGFFCFSTALVLFDNPEISKCINTLFLLHSHHCCIIGFIGDLSVAHNNNSWLS